MVKVSTRTKKTSFEVALPEANSVNVVGDFNEWSGEAHPMKKNRAGVWKLAVEIPAGEYQFRYLVDNAQWINDDSTAYVPNTFGTENSFVEVKLAAKKTTRKKATKKK